MIKTQKSFFVAIGVLAFAFFGCWKQQGSPTDDTTDSESDSESNTDTSTDTDTGPPESDSQALNSIWGSSEDDIWAVGNQYTVLHWDGTDWEQIVLNSDLGLNAAYDAVWGTGPEDVYVGGWGFHHFDGQDWHYYPFDSGCEVILDGWSCSDSEIFVVSTCTVLIDVHTEVSFYENGLVSTLWHGTDDAISWNSALWAFSSQDLLWSPGSGIDSWNGSVWTPLSTSGTVNAIWADNPNDIWAVGSTIAHFDGISWTEETPTSPVSLNGVYGFAPIDIFAAGESTIIHYDGSAWSEMSVPAVDNLQLMDVWGSSPNDVYAVGGSGAEGEWGNQKAIILHFDGLEWTVAYESE